MQIIIAKNGRQELWVLTSSFQKFMTATMSSNETNFRIQAGYVDELIRGTKCNGARFHHHDHEMPPFTEWRSWHREEFDDSRFQTVTSLRWHKHPNFFAEYHHSPSLFPPSYSFPRYFARSSFNPWIVRSMYSHRPIDYTIIDHNWRTRDYMYLIFLMWRTNSPLSPTMFLRFHRIY